MRERIVARKLGKIRREVVLLPACMSNIITYQFSPVDARNSVIIAKPKFWKLLYLVTVYPVVTLLKRNTPKTE